MSFCNRNQMPLVIAVLLAFFVGLMMCPGIYAANPNNPNNPPDNGNAVMVASVDVAHQQVTLLLKANSQRVVYTIDGGTTITVQGTAASLSQVKSGQQVNSYIERDPTTLDSIDVGPVLAGSTPDKPAKKSKKPKNNPPADN
jgi:hypothetical protein